MAIKAIINNTEKEIEQIKNSNEQDIDYVYSRVGEKEAEGEPTVSIESIGGELTNYRIYGQTADGESVGDLVTAGEHAGEYCVPVTIEGKNLLPNTATSQTMNGVTFTVNEDGSVTCNGTANGGTALFWIPTITLPAGQYSINGCPVGGSENTTYKILILANNEWLINDMGSGANFTLTETSTVSVRIAIYNGYTCDNLTFYPMIRKADIEDDTYEPYHAPVTTPIYLPEQIRKVGDEAEYIDYSEQKLHIVRKNLLLYSVESKTINGVTFRVNNDGSVTCNGTAKNDTWFTLLKNCSIFGECILSGSPFNGSDSRYLIRAYYNNDSVVADYGAGTILNFNNPFTVEIQIASGFTCRNLTFYPMIRKANIEDDTYEPYIRKTKLDIALPALSTVKGTNIFSVNTTIQPSNIYIKDNFDYKRIFTATRAIEGELPLNYRSIEDNNSTLKNYRIYGNTVGGESVGDRTGNLFDGEWENKYIAANGFIGYSTNRVLSSQIHVVAGQTYTVTAIFLIRAVHSYNGTVHTQALFDEVSGAGEVTFTIPDGSDSIKICLKKANDGNFTPDDVEWCMLNEGSTSFPYEPYGYRVPVTVSNGTDTLTTPIYLPEQIRKVGDEAEYIDYGEQKQHRVRKNLLPNTATSQTINGVTFTVNSDGSVTCNGTASSTVFFAIAEPVDLSKNIISGCPKNGSSNSYLLRCSQSDGSYVEDKGNGALIPDHGDSRVIIRINSGYTCNNLTFYPMIRKADIEDDTYEPYIENTDLDVTLPAFPTIAGTNVLSVGTQGQPSKVYLKGKLKRTIYG